MATRLLKIFLLALGLAPACNVSATDEATGATTGPTHDDTTTDLPTTTTANTAPTTTADPTADPAEGRCERLGGLQGVRALTEAFVALVLRDDRLNGYFLNQGVDPDRFAMSLGAHVGELLACDGAVYHGLDMTAAHAGMGISALDFLDFLADFHAALDAHALLHPALTLADRGGLLDLLGQMQGAIVEDPDDHLSLYQRIGRKPGIRQLVGAAGPPTALIGRLLADDAINTFFTAAALDRLHTCLTRQIAAIDGPIHYGAEVDAPPGIDLGVSGGQPCRAMGLVHDDLQDIDHTYITVDDFGAFITDLAAAMTSAGLTDLDHSLVLAAFAPLCEQIVIGSQEKNNCPGNRKQQRLERTGLAQQVPDDAYDGTLESMRCNDILVAPDPEGVERVADLTLELALDHGHIGQLTVKIQSPGGDILTVLSRPGELLMKDDGLGCCNDGSDLREAYPILFTDGALIDAADMGATLDDGGVVCKDDLRCQFRPDPGAGPGADFGDFLADTAAGTWKVCVGDSNVGDIATLDAIALTFTKTKYNPKT